MARGNREINLTQGVIWRQILLFLLPILFGSLFQQFYGIADAVIVGRFAGKEALAAVDSTSSLIRLFLNMFVGISSGATIIISQYFGGKKYREVEQAVHTAITVSLLGGAVLLVAGVAAAPFALRAMSVPEEIYRDAVTYTCIYFSGSIFLMFYNMGAGILRAVGDTRSPLYFLICASISNVALDFLFVVGFGWGVAGAAAATVLSQLISALLVAVRLAKSPWPYCLERKKLGIVLPVLKKIFSVGVPIGLQSCMYPVANIMIQARINQFGTDTVAGWAVCGKLDFPIWVMLEVFGITISTFAAQNFGAGELGRIRKSVPIALAMSGGVIGLFGVVLFLFGGRLSGFFVSDPEVIALSTHMVRFLALFYVVFCGSEIWSGAIRGTGETFKPMLITVTGTCLLRIIWTSLAVPLNPTVRMVIASFPISWVITSGAFGMYYIRYSRKHFSGEARQAETAMAD